MSSARALQRAGKLPTAKIIYIFLLLICLPLFLQLHLPRTAPPSWVTWDAKTNITLRLTGTCTTPFTYLGVDSRSHLLRYYDIAAEPLGTYNPATLNWARVVLLREVFKRCPDVPVFVYSDTDAYIPSRKNIYRRLERFPAVVYQHGMWSLNSGFSAWNPEKGASKVLTAWYKRYTPDEDFFAEQRAMLYSVGNNTWYTTGRENGFLGWHIKGGPKFKTDIANMGRMLCYYEDFVIWAVLLPIVVVLTMTVLLTLRLRYTGSVQGVKPFVQVAVVIGRLLRKDVFVLLCSSLAILIILTKTHALGEWRLYTVPWLSKQNFTHMVPGGRIMVNREMLCSGYWCIKPEEGSLADLAHRALREIARTRSLMLGIFLVYGITSIAVPRFAMACLCSIFLLAAVSLVCGAVNLSNVFVLQDVADGTFGRERRVFGTWSLRAIAPRANSGNFEVVKVQEGGV